jgi:hypothetical protein
MRRARTCPWIKIRPYRVLLRGQGVFFAVRSLADCITNMSGFDLRQAQPGDIMDCGVGSDFDAAVIAFDRLMPADLCILEAICFLLGREDLDILAQRALIAFEREDVIG